MSNNKYNNGIHSQNRDFKGIWIPKEIWLNPDLSPIEKLLLVEVDSLDNENDKGCFASNEYFGKFFGLSEGRIANMISSLKKREFLFQVFFDGRNRGLRVHKNVKAGFTKSGGRVHENVKADFTKRGKLISRKREHNNTVSKPTNNTTTTNENFDVSATDFIVKSTTEFPNVTLVELKTIEEKKEKTPPNSARPPKKEKTNTPGIHAENEPHFAYFSDPEKAKTTWLEWIEYKYSQHREKYKVAKSELAKLRQIFKQFNGDSEKFEEAVNYSIGNLYKGIFAPKIETNNGKFQHAHLDKAQQQHARLARFVADIHSGAAFADAGTVDWITGE